MQYFKNDIFDINFMFNIKRKSDFCLFANFNLALQCVISLSGGFLV